MLNRMFHDGQLRDRIVSVKSYENNKSSCSGYM